MEAMHKELQIGEPENDDLDTTSMLNGSLQTSLQNEDSLQLDTYLRLITEACQIPGGDDSIVVSNLSDIPWLDKALLHDGIHFLNKFFTLAILADTFALMFGFCVKPMSSVVLRTGKLLDPEKSFKRYLSTIQRIARFFLIPVDATLANNSFRIVRGMHNHFRTLPSIPLEDNLEPWKIEMAQAIRDDLEFFDTSPAPSHLLTWDPEVPLNQFDMAVTQFGFIGVMWSFPHVFGIKDREKEMQGVIHLWAVIGRQLGLRDEYNACLHYSEDPELFEKLYRHVLMESLKTTDETVVTIQSQFMKAFTSRVPFMTHKAMLFYGFRAVEGYKGEGLWRLMSARDKFCFRVMQFWFWGMRSSVIVMFFWNVYVGFWLQWQLWRNGLPTMLKMGIRNLWKMMWM